MSQRIFTQIKRFGPLALVAIAIVVALVSGVTRHLSLHELRERRVLLQALVHVHPILSALAYEAGYSLVIGLSLPAALPMTLAGGLLFGTVVGGLAAAIGCTLGGTLLFLACRTAAGDVLRRRTGPRFAEIEDGVRRDAFFYILTLRLIPIMPFGLTTVALGFLEIPLLTFIAATFLGILPLSLIYASLGWDLNAAFASHKRLNLHSLLQPQILAALAGLAVIALAPIVIRRLRRRSGLNIARQSPVK